MYFFVINFNNLKHVEQTLLVNLNFNSRTGEHMRNDATELKRKIFTHPQATLILERANEYKEQYKAPQEQALLAALYDFDNINEYITDLEYRIDNFVFRNT